MVGFAERLGRLGTVKALRRGTGGGPDGTGGRPRLGGDRAGSEVLDVLVSVAV